MSLPTILQEELGFPPLKKISPNTQEVKDTSGDLSGQAAIPTVLVGLYKYSITDAGAEDILRGEYSTDWVNKVFGQYYGLVVERVASYASIAEDRAESLLNTVARKAAELIRTSKEGSTGIAGIKSYLTSERHEILSYLPAALQIGELLDDDTVDDRTNKMEGPVSSLMQKIAGSFAPSDLDEKKAKNL
jgi:hypothetical protein